jgi:RNA-directed DNA polymerase
MNGGPDAGGQGEQLGLFHRDGRPAVSPPAGNRTARDLYRFENLWRAYRECRRTKRGTLNALAFEWNAEAGLFALQQELLSHRYQPGTSICFVTDGVKPREVFAADFRDRIVHHLLLHRIEPVFERRFLHDSYACRKGRGVLAASDRLTEFLRQATANTARPAWALKLDVASFFPSIHKPTLYDILCRRVRDPELRWLTATILFHDPTADFVFHKGPRFVPHPTSAAYPVEARKSLFGRGGETGLPIGNLTSQFWANCYLDELDQFVKRRLGCRHYVRYVDDLVLLAPDPETLSVWRGRIRTFAAERLRLKLRTDGDEPFPVRRGIDFVGWKTWATHRVPRRRTLATLDRRLREAGRVLVRRDEARGVETIDLTVRVAREPGTARREVVAVDALLSTLASYSGHLRWGGSWAAWHGIHRRHPWLSSVMAFGGWNVSLRWSPRNARHTRLWRQYWELASAAPPQTLVFCRVGAFVEFRGPFAEEAASALGLRTVRLARGQWAFGAGFPARLLPRFEDHALARGWSLAIVSQGGWRGGGRRPPPPREVVRVARPLRPPVVAEGRSVFAVR